MRERTVADFTLELDAADVDVRSAGRPLLDPAVVRVAARVTRRVVTTDFFGAIECLLRQRTTSIC